MSRQRVEADLQDEPGLWKLYEPPSPYQPVCDIIAVHGLGGGPVSTWTHSTRHTQSFWLRDYLPSIVQDPKNLTSARIWSFGYNANTTFSTSVSGISDFTTSLLRYLQVAGIDREQKKVIFIAHSLGGLVVKSALIDAGRHNSPHRWLLNATAGIVFLGTPHQGANIADKATYIANIAKYTGIVRPNTILLSSLKKNSRELFEKAEHFRDVCIGIQICSFYEQLEVSGARMIIVNRNSAFIGVDGEEFTPMNANHINICKFKDLEDQNLNLVRSSIERMMEKVTRGTQSRPIPGPSNSQIEDRHYDGRGPPGWGNYRYATVEDSFSDLGISDCEPSSRPSTRSTRDAFSTTPSYGQSQWQASYEQQNSTYPSDFIRDPAPQARPFRQSQSPNPRRSSPGRYQSSQSLSSQYSRDTPSTSTNSPYLQANSMYSLNQAQLQDTNRKTSPVPAKKPLPPQEPADWYCNVCTEGRLSNQVRYHCSECHDYDLCMQCHIEGYTNENHKTSHKLVSIASKHTIEADAITPCYDNVTPQYSPPRKLPNWTEEGDNYWLHLRNTPSSARFVVRRLSKGAYKVHLEIKFKFSDHVDMDTFKRAKEIGFGKLKISTGSPLSTSAFLNQPKTEDATLSQQLFGFDPSTTFLISVPDTVTTPVQPWTLTFNLDANTTYLGFDSGANPTNAILGILLQWSEVVQFQSNDNPILLMSLNVISIDELLEYAEPPPLPPPPAPPQQNAKPSPSRQPVQPTAPRASDDDDDDDEDSGVTLQELIEAAQILKNNGMEVTSDNLLKMIAARREVKSDIQMGLMLLQIQQIRERQRREQEARQRQAQIQQAQAVEAVGQLLLLSWLAGE